METGKQELPKGADFTLTVWLNRDKSSKAMYHLKEIDEDVFLAAKTLIDKGKDFDAVRMIVKSLWVGGDSPDLINKNFVALQSASAGIRELITPIEGELKKN